MKRIICIILCLMLLLSGCAKAEKQSVQIKNNTIKKMKSPEFFFFKNNLFITDNDKMVIVSTDGKKLAQSEKINGENLLFYSGDENIAVIDENKDIIYILNDNLETVKEYSIDIHGETALTSDLKTLYTFDYYNGIYKTDIETGQEEFIYECDSAAIQESFKNRVIFKAYDDEYKEYLLNKETGEISENTMPTIYEENGKTYILKDNKTFTTSVTGIGLTSDGKYFYYYNDITNYFYLYNTDFSLASYGKIPDRKLSKSEKIKFGRIAYNEENSDFIIEIINILGRSEFYYFKPDFSLTGSGLFVTENATDEPKHLADESLYEKADELYKKHGIEILIAEECKHAYGYYSSKILTDEAVITSALSKIDEALSAYPKELLSHINSEENGIKIELVKDFKCNKNNLYYDERGFLNHKSSNNFSLCVFEAEKIDDEIIYLLINEYIGKLFYFWDDYFNPKTYGFDKDEWENFLPEDFYYVLSENKAPVDEAYTQQVKEYFISKNGVQRQEKDIGEILTAAMLGKKDIFEKNDKLAAKLSYIKTCLEEMYNINTDFLKTD